MSSCRDGFVWKLLQIFCSPFHSTLTHLRWDSSVFPARASLGLGEPRRADMRRVLQCSPQPREAQLASPPPDAHTVARHATAGTKAKRKCVVDLSYTVQEQTKKHRVGLFHSHFSLQMVQTLYGNGANSIWEHSLLDPGSVMSGKRKANPQDKLQ